MDHLRKPSRHPKNRLFDWGKFDPVMLASDGRPSLVVELTTYRDRLPELLRDKGKFVVIKGDTLAVLPDRESALEYAIKTYWPTPALVKEIVDREPFDSLGGAAL